MDDRYIDNRASPRLALRVLAQSFRFRGRSTRTEVISFWFFSILANMLIHLSTSSLGLELPAVLSGTVAVIWWLVLDWPYVALLVRRLHDQGRSGSLALLSGVVVVTSTILLLLPASAAGHGPSISFFGFQRWLAWTPVTTPLLLALAIASIAILVLFLQPPTLRTNRYGPDPRIAPADEITDSSDKLATR